MEEVDIVGNIRLKYRANAKSTATACLLSIL